MKEISFRGKRIDNGEWVYGNLIYSSDACKEYETLIIPQKNADGFTTDYASNGENKESYGFDNWFCVIPETVGQYTGECIPDTTDRVFGHDIIEQSYINKLNDERIVKRYLISFEKGYYKAKCIGHSPYGDTLLHFMLANSKYFDTKIIGNKHDNPELLEV